MSTYTWIEDNSSRSAHIVRLGRKAQSTYVKSWKIFGTSDDVAVHQDVNTTIAAGLLYWQYPGQPENRLHVDHYTLEYLGDDAWQLSVTYVKEGAEDSNQPDPLKRSRSFDTSGGTAHYTQAIVKKLPNDGGFDLGERRYPVGSAPDQQGAIGVDGNSVNGVDVVVPALQWTETYDVPTAYITSTYIKQLSTLTGAVNDAEFRTFKAGEVLFLGASGAQEWDSQKGDGPWSLTFKFVASSNAGTDQTLPAIKIGSITGIEKKGHEYLWVRYEDNPVDQSLLKVPKYVYVNRVYSDGDFSQLGIGS